MALNFNTEIQNAVGREVNPSIGFSKNIKPAVNIANFGDGYSQRVVDGINNMPGTWRVSFQNQPLNVILAIENFLKARQGSELFYWTPPGDVVTVKVICVDGWDIEYTSHISRTLNTTFTQVFDPV